MRVQGAAEQAQQDVMEVFGDRRHGLRLIEDLWTRKGSATLGRGTERRSSFERRF